MKASRPAADNEFNLELDRNPGMATALTFHKRANRTETGLGAFQRNRLEQDEVCSQFGSAFKGYLAINDGYRYGTLVCGGGTGPFEDAGGHFRDCAIYNDAFKALAGDFLDRGVGIRAVLHADFKFT